jgi:hypothetical protein
VWRRTRIPPSYSLRVVSDDRNGAQWPGVYLDQSPMRQQSMVMGLERPGPKIHYDTIDRTALSSERASHFKTK